MVSEEKGSVITEHERRVRACVRQIAHPDDAKSALKLYQELQQELQELGPEFSPDWNRAGDVRLQIAGETALMLVCVVRLLDRVQKLEEVVQP